MNKKIKIIVVDDHPVVRGGIVNFLSRENDIEVCGEAESAGEAIRLINELEPDFVIVDLSLKGGTDGLELIKAINSRFPEVRMLCLSMYEESVYAERAIRAGAKGYLQKSAEPGNLIKAIRRIMDGKLYMSEDIADTIVSRLLHGVSHDRSDFFVDELTDREFEVFLLIGNGYATKDISKKMNLSPNTVESHKKNIKAKLDVGDSSDLNKIAVQWVIDHQKKI